MLSQQEQLKFCKICLNRKFDPKRGIVCELNNSKPNFELDCSNYDKDSIAIARDIILKEDLQKRNRKTNDFTFGINKLGIKNGIIAGIILISIGLAWLFIGLQYNFVFWYPIILIIMGTIALFIGIFNMSLNYYEKRQTSTHKPQPSDFVIDD